MAVAMVPIGAGRDVHGRPALLRPEAAAAWTAAVTLVKLELGIDLDARILQAAGDADASAGVHLDGAAVDIRVWGLTRAQIRALVLLLRNCGFAATWYRDWPGNAHIHAAAKLRGISTRVAYQVRAVEAGFDGLGADGRAGRDPDPRPTIWRDHVSGRAWALARITHLNATELERFLNTMDEAKLREIIRAEATAAAKAANDDFWGAIVPDPDNASRKADPAALGASRNNLLVVMSNRIRAIHDRVIGGAK